MDDLVKRLREKHENWALGQKGPRWLLDAADRIEADAKRIAELERERNGLIAKSLENDIMRKASEAKYLDAEQRRMEAAERIIALEDDADEFRAVNTYLEARVKVLEGVLIEIADRDWRWAGGGSDTRIRGSYGRMAARTLGVPVKLPPGWPIAGKSETRATLEGEK